MWKVFLAGVVAIGLLVAGSVAALFALTGDSRPRQAGGAATPGSALAGADAPSDASSPPPVPLAPGAVTFGGAPPPVEPPAPSRGAAPPPPRGSWEAVPITSRAKALGRLGGLIQAKLNDLQDDLRTCFTAEAQARHGGGAISTVRDAAPMDDTGTLVLVLQLEGQPGAIRIVDAPVETRGPAGDQLIACAQDFLRGRVLEVPGAAPGAKYRLLFPLMP